MSAVLYGSSTLAMVLLLAVLAARAWQELLGFSAPRFLSAPEDRVLRRERPRFRRDTEVIILSLAVLWTLCFVGAWVRGHERDFFPWLVQRFTEAGDAPHYLFLAEHGYQTEGEKINLIVFYPLYPWLMGLLGRILGGRYVLAGILISQLSFGAASVVLCRMLRAEGGAPALGLAAFLFYPFAFFSLGVFTEGLFLLLSLSALWALRRESWGSAGLLGFLTILCRVQGIALFPVYLYAAWRAAKRDGYTAKMLFGLLIPLGWGLYLCLNRYFCGDFFAFRYYESIRPWWQSTQWLGKTLAQQLSMAQQYPFLGKIIYLPQLVIYYAAFALLLAGLFRKMRTEYAVFGTAYLGMCYLASWLISGGRYMLGCAGLWFAVSKLRREWVRIAVICVELAACLWFYSNFMGGESIM